MTPDEAKAVLAAAAESARYHRWADIDHLLRHVYDAHVLAGTDQGEAAYLLGMAYNASIAESFFGLEHEAREHLDFAVAHGPTDVAAKAHQRLEAIDRHDQAELVVAELAEH